MRALQQIGLRHPRIRQVRHIASGAGQDRQLLVVEGLWAHRVLVGLDAAVEMFLWCPGGGLLGRGAVARHPGRGEGALRLPHRARGP
jgi:hypothetical protein